MKSIKVQRKESLLKELVMEALSSMNDSRLNTLSVLDVVCSRDGSDAKVYLEKSFLDKKGQNETLKQLTKSIGYVSKYCLESSGWFKVPKMTFTFDELFENEQHLESLFDRIKK